MDWFLYDRDLRHERVKIVLIVELVPDTAKLAILDRVELQIFFKEVVWYFTKTKNAIYVL